MLALKGVCLSAGAWLLGFATGFCLIANAQADGAHVAKWHSSAVCFLYEEVHHERCHDFFLFWLRFGNHDGGCYEGAIAHGLLVVPVEQTAPLQEVEKDCRSDSFIPVVERMALYDEVEEIRCLFLN